MDGCVIVTIVKMCLNRYKFIIKSVGSNKKYDYMDMAWGEYIRGIL